jgi:hypothetical protein
MLGHHYAMKREPAGSSNDSLVRKVEGEWVQKPITYTTVGGMLYSLYDLAAGDLGDALHGHRLSFSSANACGDSGISGSAVAPPSLNDPQQQPAAVAAGAAQHDQEAPTKRAPFQHRLKALFKLDDKKPQTQPSKQPQPSPQPQPQPQPQPSPQPQPQPQPSAGNLLPTATAKALAAELVTAVGTVHEAGIVHLDLKAENFLVAADGHLRLGDFGCAARACQPALGASGTPFFMAPEQHTDLDGFWRRLGANIRKELQDFAFLLGFKFNSRPADVWALGATLLTALLPFPEAEAALAAARAGKKWVPAPGSAGAALPADLWDLLFSCMLARRPGRRLTVRHLKGHAFFAGVDWAAVEARTVPLPIDLVALAKIGREAAAAAADDAGAGADPVA